MVSLVLVLVSFALVILAAVLLVLGLLMENGLPLIYVSIACSVAAGVVLFVATQRNRGRPAEAPSAPAPLEREEPVPVVAGARDEPTAVTPTAPAAAATPVEPAAAAADDDVELDEDFFPIADYDDLKVSEIMPLLPELYPEELDEVEARERAGKARVTILDRIAELREQAGDRLDEPVGAPAAGAGDEDGEGWDVTEDDWGPPAGAAEFPIADYDELTVAEITPLLDDLDDDELLMVREREAATDARRSILTAIDRLLGEDEAAPAKPAATRKRAATKAAAKKSPAKKAAAKKGAAKKAAAKKSPAKKAAAKKGAGKKAAAKKGAGKKAAAKKAAATRKRA